MTPKSGVITPDLIGYGLYNNPTNASVILENEIYFRRRINENDFAKILTPLKEILNTQYYGNDANQTSNTKGQKPIQPNSTLLSSGKVDPVKGGFVGNTIIFANRAATTICDEKRVLQKATEKQKPKKQTGMDFSNIPNRKTMFEKFKFYYEKKNPNKFFATEDIRKNGPNKDKYGVPPKLEVEKFISQNWQYPSDDGVNIYDIAISVGYNKTQSKQILEKFGTQNEKGEIYWRNLTEKNKKEKEIEKQKEEEKQFLSSKQEDLTKNKLVLRVFPNAAKLVQDEDCKVQYLKFFQGIVDGSIRNKNNKVVGQPYYNKKGQLYYAKWNEPEPPCSDEWWDEYGMYVQIGGLIAISLLTAGLGAIPSTAGAIIRASSTFINLAADTALNLYSLKQAVKSQDEERIKMEYAYLLLPFLFETKGVQTLLKNTKLGSQNIKSVEDKMKSLGSYPDPNEVKRVISSMSNEEKLVVNELKKPEYQSAIERAGKEFSEKLKLTPKVSSSKTLLRYVSNPLINVLAYGSPAAIYLASEIKKQLNQKVGVSLNVEEERLWQLALSYYNENDLQKIAQTLNDQSVLEKYADILKSPKSAELQKEIRKLYGDDPNLDYVKEAENLNKKMQSFVLDIGNVVEDSLDTDLNILSEPEIVENSSKIEEVVNGKKEPPKKTMP